MSDELQKDQLDVSTEISEDATVDEIIQNVNEITEENNVVLNEETVVLENTYDDFLQEVSDEPMNNSKKNKKGKGLLIALICIASVLVLLIGAAVSMYFLYDGGMIVNGVTVAGVDVGGMKMSEARAAVEAATADTFSSNNMKVSVLDTTVEIPAEYFESFNVRGAVWKAYIYGNIGLPASVEEQKKVAAESGYAVDLSLFLNLNRSGINELLSVFDEKYNTDLVQTVFEISGEKPSTEQIQSGSNLQTLNIKMGSPDYTLDMDALNKAVMRTYSSNTFALVFPCDIVEPDPIDLEQIVAPLYIPAVDASLDPNTAEVVPSTFGYGFDMDEAKKTVELAQYSADIQIPFTRLDADLTTEELKAKLFRDVLSTYTAVSSSSSNRDTNLRLACAAVNGLILKPGETFSYNGTLGQRTAAKGYKPAGAYVGGQTVATYGGGVCQVSSSLYYCALLADLEIVDRRNHGYESAYMDYGMDATVDWGTVDFKFKNNMDYPIRIEASSKGGTTTIKLVGTDERDYYVKMEYEILGRIGYSVVYQDEKPGSGYRDGQVLQTPYVGYNVKTYRCKYDKATNELISRTFEATSNYRKRDKIIVRIIQPEPAPTPTPTPTPTPDAGGTQ